MYKLRKEDSSVYLYLKDIVLANFIEFREKDAVSYSAKMSSDKYKVYTIDNEFDVDPFARGRGIVYFDDLTNEPLVNSVDYFGTKEQLSRVVLYDDILNEIAESDYIVDYMDGRILITSYVKPYYIDYYWNYVGLVDEWSLVTSTKAPVVVLDISATKKEGFQLGGGKKVVRKGSLIIFATSASERNDIAEVIYDGLYLKSCALYDFKKGLPLDYDGTFKGRKENLDKSTNLFSREVIDYTSNLSFEEVEMKHINLPFSNTASSLPIDLNAYRSRITFDLVSYVEG
ncbi:hypothetical protein JZU46_00120 [bacterium]|nr:hypothetical protein [bacterium]